MMLGAGTQPIKMTKPLRTTVSPIGLIILLGLIGCSEQSPIIYHEAHVYKGKKDLHSARENTLDHRFKQTQTDR
jgi:hypothetical protein